MSYCRWSNDDHNCDLYCYEDRDGWVTHVAGNRVVGEVPHVDYWLMGSPAESAAAELARQMEVQDAFLETCERVPIGLGHDGATFHDGSLEAFRDRLVMLRDAGYRFPAEVLAQVSLEISERDGGSDDGQRDEVAD